MGSNGIWYSIYAGTLLGAVRHKGIIPWDSDRDVIVDSKDIPKISSKEVKLEANMLGYKIEETKAGYWKFKDMSGSGCQLDIFQVSKGRKNGVDVMKYDFHSPGWNNCYIEINNLFPLKLYPFANMMVWGPKNPRPFLDRWYGDDWEKVGYITQTTDTHDMLKTPIKVGVTEFVPARDFYEF